MQKTREELIAIIKLGVLQREAAKEYYKTAAAWKKNPTPELERQKYDLLKKSKALEKRFDEDAANALSEETSPTLF